MVQSFRGKNIKDVEAAPDTIMHNAELTTEGRNKKSSDKSLSMSFKCLNSENIDTFLEKKDK
ncbi:hypothetical protein DFR58_11646 [Anaerobacterium chartisolvens]|uniref:Uncharacterized protein n=1 Tax=Anaerobacterium chartisolvens TaxID=1297424 RepID=A0A369B277_9FIRM|nr:hypothetical protein [Anaerobacterium chartisolvens]RCX13814.1 hypothetical protein DFR58_11646 [Anaerobacterium chartisolvens]